MSTELNVWSPRVHPAGVIHLSLRRVFPDQHMLRFCSPKPIRGNWFIHGQGLCRITERGPPMYSRHYPSKHTAGSQGPACAHPRSNYIHTVLLGVLVYAMEGESTPEPENLLATCCSVSPALSIMLSAVQLRRFSLPLMIAETF